MTIVRLRLAGCGQGTSCSIVRLHGLVPREWSELRAPDPDATPDATGVAIREAITDSDRRRLRRKR